MNRIYLYALWHNDVIKLRIEDKKVLSLTSQAGLAASRVEEMVKRIKSRKFA